MLIDISMFYNWLLYNLIILDPINGKNRYNRSWLLIPNRF